MSGKLVSRTDYAAIFIDEVEYFRDIMTTNRTFSRV